MFLAARLLIDIKYITISLYLMLTYNIFLCSLSEAGIITSNQTVINKNHTGKYLFGKIETVNSIDNISINYNALIDSGSTLSSLNAKNISIKKHKDGSSWVYFDLPTNHKKSIKMIKPLMRFAYIKTHNTKHQKRPVIEATITIGSIKTTTQFSLTPRSQFKQPLILGLNTLEPFALIDPSASFLLKHIGQY